MEVPIAVDNHKGTGLHQMPKSSMHILIQDN